MPNLSKIVKKLNKDKNIKQVYKKNKKNINIINDEIHNDIYKDIKIINDIKNKKNINDNEKDIDDKSEQDLKNIVKEYKFIIKIIDIFIFTLIFTLIITMIVYVKDIIENQANAIIYYKNEYSILEKENKLLKDELITYKKHGCFAKNGDFVKNNHIVKEGNTSFQCKDGEWLIK